MMERAITREILDTQPVILDASSGNMACSIAYFGSLLGLPTRVAVSSKLTKEKRDFLELFGASVIVVGERTIDGNQYCQQLVKEGNSENYLFLDQLHNWDNPRAHYEGTGPEILRDFPNCRMIVGSLGSGGTLLGTARFLKQHIPDIVVVATESVNGTRIPGVGAFDDGDYVTPFIHAGIAERCFDVRYQVSLAAAAERVLAARAQGVFGGLQTGAVLHAAMAVVRDHDIAGDVVVVSGDSGWKNVESLRGLGTPVRSLS